MLETLVLTFRQIYMSSSEYNSNYKTSVLNILYNKTYSTIHFIVGLNSNCLSCVIITSLFYVLCNYNTKHSFYTQII